MLAEDFLRTQDMARPPTAGRRAVLALAVCIVLVALTGCAHRDSPGGASPAAEPAPVADSSGPWSTVPAEEEPVPALEDADVDAFDEELVEYDGDSEEDAAMPEHLGWQPVEMPPDVEDEVADDGALEQEEEGEQEPEEDSGEEGEDEEPIWPPRRRLPPDEDPDGGDEEPPPSWDDEG